jgi:hypothetical protein
MTQTTRGFLGLAFLAAGLGVLASPASAGPTLTFNLNQISDPSIGTGSLGTVTLTQDSATMVDVMVAISPYSFINTGGPHTPFSFNVSGSGLSVSFVLPTNGVYGAGTFSYNAAGGGNTPYGTFSGAIDSSAGNGSGKGYGGGLEFTVTRATGLSITDFIGDSLGYYFAADVSNGTNTGAIASRGPISTTVPEPASMAVLGTGLFGLGAVAMARRYRSA